MDRQRRTANPDHYDEHGRIEEARPEKLRWKASRA